MRRRILAGDRSKYAAAHGTGLALALVIGVVAYQGFFRPLRSDMAEHGLHAQRVELLIARGDEAARNHRAMRQRRAELTAAAKRVRERMPTKASAGEFVAQSTEIASQYGLEVLQCTSGPPQPHEKFTTINVNCSLSGSFASVCQYLAAVDQLPQLSRVRHFEMARSAESEGYPVQVTFELYYQVDPLDKD